MRENAHAKRPVVWEQKKSPGHSPSRDGFPLSLQNGLNTLRNTGSSSNQNKHFYEDYISTFLKPEMLSLEPIEEHTAPVKKTHNNNPS